MKEENSYEIQKQKYKQKLVRNEFLFEGKSTGLFNFPIIKKQEIDVDKITLLSYVDAKKNDKENMDKTIHFFTYDWKFEKVFETPDDELEKLSQYYCLLSPDFSLFTNMPLALQIASVFKNRWCGAFWQDHGLKVIPTISWGDERTFDFCFDGVEEGSIVCVCTYYRENCEEEFMRGYNEMLKRIKPSIVLCYDEPFKSMNGNIKTFIPTTYEWTKNLSWKDLTQFKWEKQNKNISGLNEKDFKFFNYVDSYEKNNIKPCDVCGKVVAVNQFGYGNCKNCGWCQDPSRIKFPDKVQYPNLLSLNKAKTLYKEGKEMKPDLDDFLDGLFMYSEMEFFYENKKFGVVIEDGAINIFEDGNFNNVQIFKTKDDFKSNAKVHGALLKDVWHKVTKVNYMQG